jgi:hypothetical protein
MPGEYFLQNKQKLKAAQNPFAPSSMSRSGIRRSSIACGPGA